MGLKPTYRIEFNGKNITDYIEPFCLGLSFVDKSNKEADELTITLDDSKNIWISDWYPVKGDEIKAWIGYEGFPLRYCGNFAIDEPTFSGPPDQLELKGASTNIGKSIKQKNSQKYTNKTLRQIAEEVAKKHDYSVKGTIKNILIRHRQQMAEPDLEFLQGLANQYGHVIKISDNNLIFFDKYALSTQKHTHSFKKSDLSGYSFVDKSLGVYNACTVEYYDPDKKKVISHTEKRTSSASGSTLKLKKRAENKQQAEEMAKSALINSIKEVEGNITLAGISDLYAGSNIYLEKDFYKMSGTYQADEVSHSIIPKQGYSIDVKLSKSL